MRRRENRYKGREEEREPKGDEEEREGDVGNPRRGYGNEEEDRGERGRFCAMRKERGERKA